MAGYPGSFIAGTASAPTAASAPGIWRVAEAMQAKAAGSWPAQVTADPLFNYVTLLLSGDGTNGAQNNTFVDSSGNNLTITRNGNTTQGSFSPYGDRWSNYFDGSGDTLTTNGADLALGAGDFTVEYWVNAAVVSDARTIFNFSPTAAGGAYGFFVRINGTSSWQFYLGNGSSWVASGNFGSFSTNPINGVWQHHAVVRQSGVLKFYIDGAEAFSVANTTNIAHQYLTIGNYAGYIWWGYISNFRVVKGPALYTGNFTPPTAPLTAVSGTSLLICHANRFVDSSSNNFTITRNGDVRVEKFSPFAPTAAYLPATIGGSAYFDGTGDFLSLADDAALNPGTSDFLIEAWVYFSGTTGSNQGINGKGVAGSSGYSFYITSSNVLSFIWNGAGGTTITAGTVTIGGWSHVCVVRNNGVIRAYLNGVGAANATTCTTDITSTAPKYVGQARGANPILGYMGSYRMVKGALPPGYDATQAACSVPASMFSSDESTSLLLNFTNAGVFDSSTQAVVETLGNAQISTSVSKFGTGSIAFDGATDAVFSPLTYVNPGLAFGSGDFTIECWVNFNSVSSRQVLFGQGWNATNFGTQGGFTLDMAGNTGGKLSLAVGTANTSAFWLQSMGAFTVGQWNHVAMVRYGQSVKIYQNGVAVGSGTLASSATLLANFGRINIGMYENNMFSLNGYIDDFRITKGVARYTDNFTPPEAPFQNK